LVRKQKIKILLDLETFSGTSRGNKYQQNHWKEVTTMAKKKAAKKKTKKVAKKKKKK
jgi:hypothetical protein